MHDLVAWQHYTSPVCPPHLEHGTGHLPTDLAFSSHGYIFCSGSSIHRACEAVKAKTRRCPMKVSPPQMPLISSPGWVYSVTSQLPKGLFWKLSLAVCLSQENLAARHWYLQQLPLYSLSTLWAVPSLTSGVPTTAIRAFTPRKN